MIELFSCFEDEPSDLFLELEKDPLVLEGDELDRRGADVGACLVLGEREESMDSRVNVEELDGNDGVDSVAGEGASRSTSSDVDDEIAPSLCGRSAVTRGLGVTEGLRLVVAL